MPDFNRAAFSREDVPDAKRGQPAVELRDYATGRGLEFLDHGTPAGYRAALPGSPDRQHNVMRGILPGGAYGVLAHETLRLGYSGESFDWGGAFYGVRLTARANMKPWQRLLSFVPVVGDVTTPPATATVSLPCTVAAIRVPETIAVQPCLRIDTRRSAPPYTFGDRFKLDRAGLPGWSAWGDPAPGADLVAALLTDSVRDLLRPRGGDDGLFQLIVWFGTLLVRRNGYLSAPEELDELARAASLVAGELRKACAAAATSAASAGSGTPGSCSDRLPPVVWRKGKPPMTVACWTPGAIGPRTRPPVWGCRLRIPSPITKRFPPSRCREPRRWSSTGSSLRSATGGSWSIASVTHFVPPLSSPTRLARRRPRPAESLSRATFAGRSCPRGPGGVEHQQLPR